MIPKKQPSNPLPGEFWDDETRPELRVEVMHNPYSEMQHFATHQYDGSAWRQLKSNDEAQELHDLVNDQIKDGENLKGILNTSAEAPLIDVRSEARKMLPELKPKRPELRLTNYVESEALLMALAGRYDEMRAYIADMDPHQLKVLEDGSRQLYNAAINLRAAKEGRTQADLDSVG